MSGYIAKTWVNVPDPQNPPPGAIAINEVEIQRIDDGVEAAHNELASHEGDVTNPHDVTAAQTGAASSSDLTNHEGDDTAHGSTPNATAGKIVRRDSNGRAKVANPSGDSDISTKSYVDSNTATNNHTHETKKAAVMAVNGDVPTGSDVLDFDLDAWEGMDLVEVIARVKGAPGAGGLSINPTRGGTDILSSDLTISSGANRGTSASFSTGSISKGQKLQLSVTAANGASDLVVYVVYKASTEVPS